MCLNKKNFNFITLGWILTYIFPFILIAHGTCNQGDDTPWFFAFFYLTPFVILGLFLIFLSKEQIYNKRYLGLFHVISIIIGFLTLPQYWIKTTWLNNSLCSAMWGGFEGENVLWWHIAWSPLMTMILCIIVYFNFIAWFKPINRKN